jgi:hypothetical protein
MAMAVELVSTAMVAAKVAAPGACTLMASWPVAIRLWFSVRHDRKGRADGAGVRCGSSPGERQGRHARPGKTRNECLIDRALSEFSSKPENLRGACNVNEATSHEPRRMGRDRQFPWLWRQIMLMELVPVLAVRRKPTVNGE